MKEKASYSTLATLIEYAKFPQKAIALIDNERPKTSLMTMGSALEAVIVNNDYALYSGEKNRSSKEYKEWAKVQTATHLLTVKELERLEEEAKSIRPILDLTNRMQRASAFCSMSIEDDLVHGYMDYFDGRTCWELKRTAIEKFERALDYNYYPLQAYIYNTQCKDFKWIAVDPQAHVAQVFIPGFAILERGRQLFNMGMVLFNDYKQGKLEQISEIIIGNTYIEGEF